MATFNKKISTRVKHQVPDFVLDEHPRFLEFIKQYYTFMESAEISVTSVQSTDGIQLESETDLHASVLLLDANRISSGNTQEGAGDKVLQETSSFGKFENGETITGVTSGATSIVLVEDLGNGKLFIKAQDKFKDGELITGNTSGAQAVLDNYRPNPVQNIQQLTNFRDPDKVLSNFLTKFRSEFMATLPEKLDDNINKRNLIKNIRSLYLAKGTAKANAVFFKMLFNENSETIYPRENMLRVSDGKFDSKKILRAIPSVGTPTDLIGRTITGVTSESTAIVETINTFNIAGVNVVEFILNEDSITGDFVADEVIQGTKTDISDNFIKLTITSIPSVLTLSNDGANYSTTDTVTISNTGGTGATIQIDELGLGPITDIFVGNGGTNYEIGDTVNFTFDTGGSASAKISVVNGGIAPETGDVSSYGMETFDHIVLEDATQIGDHYTGDKFVQESGTGNNDITDVRIINGGYGMSTLPTTTITSTSGSGATLHPYGSEIGRIIKLKIVEYGKNYEDSPSPPTLTFPTQLIVTGASGNFTVGETVSGLGTDGSTTVSATVVSWNSSTGHMEVSSPTGVFDTRVTLTGTTSTQTGIIRVVDTATASTTVDTVVDTDGVFLNEDGHVSESTMKVQDSLYYQDFSYVIKVGRAIVDWRKSFKDTIHPTGFYVTGQVNVETSLDASMSSPVEGVVSGIEHAGLALIINTLFSTILGRRLGTVDDGTTLRSNSHIGVGVDLDDSTSEHFTTNTRDVTLTRDFTLKYQLKERYDLSHRGIVSQINGSALGNRFRNINRHWYMFSGGSNPQTGAIGGDSTEATYIQEMTIGEMSEMFRTHAIQGTKNTSLDGEEIIIGDYEHPKLRTNITFPTEIRINYN
jgi:hypothetical protein